LRERVFFRSLLCPALFHSRPSALPPLGSDDCLPQNGLAEGVTSIFLCCIPPSPSLHLRVSFTFFPASGGSLFGTCVRKPFLHGLFPPRFNFPSLFFEQARPFLFWDRTQYFLFSPFSSAFIEFFFPSILFPKITASGLTS